ncbi:uncharacterized protein [Halyomorpha halys]|uniref:uncharacterized protein isoform X4 n=1 Tax=Halyomorpha halys TaxID=286706 RepID=UPI0006D4DB64|nr:uncharacterized protein LOC106690010 isoform X4 [Halyomorpha halys]
MGRYWIIFWALLITTCFIKQSEGKVVQQQKAKVVQQPDGKVVQPPEENIILLGNGTFQLADNLTLQGFMQECTTEANIFRCCVGFQSTVNMTACISVEYLKDEYGFEVNVTVAGSVIYSEKVSAKNPPPICYHIPYMAKIADACFRIYDLDIKNKILTGCANIEIHIEFLKSLKYRLGCFDIPVIFSKKKMYEVNFMKNDLI